jgi:hypothetical protein
MSAAIRSLLTTSENNGGGFERHPTNSASRFGSCSPLEEEGPASFLIGDLVQGWSSVLGLTGLTAWFGLTEIGPDTGTGLAVVR